ncbi:hypothetical protein [Microbacterium sp. ZOR0019]|uniref:hypothetical protein n=1 Tax=Microbacterium sp. ZOR0019 TaxID=1339233 RepID=UPI0012E0BC10|nr:hypothetical protein [Microbacterium sp. ZOR0019]
MDDQDHDLSCRLFGFSRADAGPSSVVSRLDLGWGRPKRGDYSVFTVDIPVDDRRADLGEALDRATHDGQTILEALATEADVDVDVVLWFAPRIAPTSAIFSGQWLKDCGRSFEIWAEVDLAEEEADDPTPPAVDRVAVTWLSDDQSRTVEIIESEAPQRQTCLNRTLHDAIAERASSVRIDLEASAGIAGIVIPAPLVQRFREGDVQLEIRGWRTAPEAHRSSLDDLDSQPHPSRATPEGTTHP